MKLSNLNFGMKAGRPSASKTGPNLSDLADKADTVRVNFDLDREEHMKLKIHAAKNRCSITDILRKFIHSIDAKSD